MFRIKTSVTLCLEYKLRDSVLKKQALWNKTKSIWNNNGDEWKISVINTVKMFADWQLFIIFADELLFIDYKKN